MHIIYFHPPIPKGHICYMYVYVYMYMFCVYMYTPAHIHFTKSGKYLCVGYYFECFILIYSLTPHSKPLS